MSEVLLRGGEVVDATGSRVADVLIRDGEIAGVGEGLDVRRGGRTLDAGGCVVAPGLVDLHAHLRQPGREEAETVESGSRAAALGGYTAVVAMPTPNRRWTARPSCARCSSWESRPYATSTSPARSPRTARAPSWRRW